MDVPLVAESPRPNLGPGNREESLVDGRQLDS